MPTLAQMQNIPIPKSADEFEDITLDALKLGWNTQQLERNGRGGQGQSGVDICGKNYDVGRVGIQCKNYYNTELTKNIIKKEIENAENFTPKINKYYIATTIPRDAKLQKIVRIISKERVNKDKFPVGIIFWQDIIQDLLLNKNYFKKYYPEIVYPGNKENMDNKTIKINLSGLLDLTTFGFNMKYYMNLVFGELGSLTNTDPLEMEALCELIEGGANFIKADYKRIRFLSLIKEFKTYVFDNILKNKELPNGWKPADNIATQIKNIVLGLENKLFGEELLVYGIGKQISFWEVKISNNKISEKSIEKMKRKIEKLDICEEMTNDLKTILDQELNSDEISSCMVPNKIYNIIRETLINNSIYN